MARSVAFYPDADPPTIEYTDSNEETHVYEFEWVWGSVDGNSTTEQVLVPKEHNPQFLDQPYIMEYLDEQEQQNGLTIAPRSKVEITNVM